MKKLAATAIGTALALSCGTAQSANSSYDIGTLGATLFNNTFAVAPGPFPNIFLDAHTFDLNGSLPSMVQGNIKEFQFGSLLDIANGMFSLGVFDSSNNQVTDTNLDPLVFQGTLNPGNDYYFGVLGMTTGSAGGAYSLSAIAQPVPEAETWAMMVAGLGLLGWYFSSRRRTAEEHPEGLPATA
ncbi:MAG: FxDxF family PEP-CTERM protein [Pseudomonadota bacterium]